MRRLIFAIVGAIGAMAVAGRMPARANLFTHILREAGESGGEVAARGASRLGAIGKAATHLKGLKGAPPGALAAHATPEGHWTFFNREGEVFTAGTPDEMQRVLATLAPDAVSAGHGKMTLYVSEESVFQNRSALDLLPKDAQLNVVTDHGAFDIARGIGGLSVKLRPHIEMVLSEQAIFDEALSYLGRPFNPANIRTVALEPGNKARIPAAPARDPISKIPLTERIDPADLATAFALIRGQTVVVAGQVEGGNLVVISAAGAVIRRPVDDLIGAARANDVNLIILHTDATRQPGSLNWLWQRMEVGGLKDAGKAASNGDFLEEFAARRGGFRLSGSLEGTGRVHFAVAPGGSGGLVNGTSNYITDTVGQVTGEILTKAADLDVRDDRAQTELDARIIPGVPTYIQLPYLISFVAGLLAWSTVRGWWHRIWPMPASSGGRLKSLLKRAPKELVYWFGFLPVIGLPALIVQTLVQIWEMATAPFRWVNRRFLRRHV